MMNNNLIITTTNNIEGCPIERYIDTICTNVVVGTNIFSDFTASLSDFFGGFSGTYKNKLELIYNEAVKELKEKAKKLGANAIIGFSIDFDEVSGGGKSMFMVSVSGTACVIKKTAATVTEEDKLGIVSQDFIDFEIKRRYVTETINNGGRITNSLKEFLYEYPQICIINNLINRYIEYYSSPHIEIKECLEFIKRYFNLLPKQNLIEEVYPLLLEHKKELKDLIINCNLFSAKHILSVAKEDLHLAISLFEAKKDFYVKEDLDYMKKILDIIDSLPNTGNIQMVKGGFLSKEQEKYVCANGHKNDKEVEFCETCGINIKGLNITEVENIYEFMLTIEILSANL